jgi:hypothetical protein
MQSSDLADLIQMLDHNPHTVSPAHESEHYVDPEDYMFHINDNDIDPYYLNPGATPEEPLLKKARKTGTRIKYWEKGWGLMLQDPSLMIPDSREVKQFRRRFRVTFSLFNYVVDLCKRKEIFSTHQGCSKNHWVSNN